MFEIRDNKKVNEFFVKYNFYAVVEGPVSINMIYLTIRCRKAT